MIRPCFICSEPHWQNGRLVNPGTSANCGHREMELAVLEMALRRERAEAERTEYFGPLRKGPGVAGKVVAMEAVHG